MALLVLLAGAMVGRAQPYTLESFALGGGGGASSGGAYTLSGTIGQPDTGTLSGGSYTLEPGIWVSEVIVPGLPELTLRLLSNGSVQICWPSSATGFVLQESPALNSLTWSPSALVPADDGTLKCVTIPTLVGERFFRLAK